jgi:hypothetical protein
MPDRNLRAGKFVNCREWQGFLSAVQCAASYPKHAVQSSRAWFNGVWFSERTANTSNWVALNRISVPR